MTHLRLVTGASPAPTAAIHAEHLRVAYPGLARPALDDVSLRVPAGSVTALVGANGAGKSTLLKALAGAIDLAGGSVRVFDAPLPRVRRRVAYLPQVSEIDWRFPMSVQAFALLGRYPHLGWLRRPGARDRALGRESLARVGLDALGGRQIGELSGGQRQRLLLARALAQGADLLLLDEPLNAVDAETESAVLELLRTLKATGATIVVATHDVDALAGLVDAVVTLAGGRILPPADEVAPRLQAHAGVAWAG